MEDLDLENFMGHFRKNHEQDNKPVNQYINSRVSQEKDFYQETDNYTLDKMAIQQITQQVHWNFNKENPIRGKVF